MRTANATTRDVTFSVPRLLAFVDLGFLYEAAKIADDNLRRKISTAKKNADRNAVGNLNATRQALLRAVFIASYAMFEQNLDELTEIQRHIKGITIAASDLKDRGVMRSVTYANKVLGASINTALDHWRDLFLLQDVRNHLAHYGPDFTDSKDHNARFGRFTKSTYFTLEPAICFSLKQIREISALYLKCIKDFSSNAVPSQPKSG